MNTTQTHAEWGELLLRSKAGDEDARQRLMLAVAEAIRPIATRMSASKAPLLDESHANEAVNNAILKLFPLDRTSGIYTVIDANTIKRYATVVVVNEVYNLMRSQQRLNSLARLDQEGVDGQSLLDKITDAMAPNPADLSAATQEADRKKQLEQIRSMLQSAMETLRPEERMAVYFRYISHPDKEIAIRSVADLMHTTEDNANNWIYRGLNKLLEVLKDAEIPNV